MQHARLRLLSCFAVSSLVRIGMFYSTVLYRQVGGAMNELPTVKQETIRQHSPSAVKFRLCELKMEAKLSGITRGLWVR